MMVPCLSTCVPPSEVCLEFISPKIILLGICCMSWLSFLLIKCDQAEQWMWMRVRWNGVDVLIEMRYVTYENFSLMM